MSHSKVEEVMRKVLGNQSGLRLRGGEGRLRLRERRVVVMAGCWKWWMREKVVELLL